MEKRRIWSVPSSGRLEVNAANSSNISLFDIVCLQTLWSMMMLNLDSFISFSLVWVFYFSSPVSLLLQNIPRWVSLRWNLTFLPKCQQAAVECTRTFDISWNNVSCSEHCFYCWKLITSVWPTPSLILEAKGTFFDSCIGIWTTTLLITTFISQAQQLHNCITEIMKLILWTISTRHWHQYTNESKFDFLNKFNRKYNSLTSGANDPDQIKPSGVFMTSLW